MIRLARADEVDVITNIECAATAAFADLGMAPLVDEPGTAPGDVRAIIAADRAWVCTDESELPVGFVLVSVVDGCAHIEQISVHPSWARRGIGASLLDAVESWARRGRLRALSLTTFADVPWNAPYYARLGFSPLRSSDLSPGERQIADSNSNTVLGRWPRVTMQRSVGRES